jgi:la-related protein 1
LRTHPGSGRLWAVRVQLEAFVGLDAQTIALRKAIEAVPKSGEVWCEAARIALNPLSRFFNIAAARRYLEFAYRFTPQHSDSLIEMIRVELLEKGTRADFQEIRKKLLCSEGNCGLLFVFMRKLAERPLSSPCNCSRIASES